MSIKAALAREIRIERGDAIYKHIWRNNRVAPALQKCYRSIHPTLTPCFKSTLWIINTSSQASSPPGGWHLHLLWLPRPHPSSYPPPPNISLLWKEAHPSAWGLRRLNISSTEKKWMQQRRISASTSLNRIEKVPGGIEIDRFPGSSGCSYRGGCQSWWMNVCESHTHTQAVGVQ